MQTGRSTNVVIVGGGWAGFGAAKSLAEAGGYNVTLLDANPNPGGLSSGWRTREGRTVEAGMKGFWYQYPNIYSLIQSELRLENVLTDWTKSSFYSPKGLQVEAPVFQREPRLPSPLGLAVYTRTLFRDLPIADRASMGPLLYALIDYDRDPASYAKYDKMSAHELFRRFGVSQRLYEEFLKPILLVGLFAPPEELSAAVVLGMLYFYVLAHQADFDVRWCRGSISETILAPLAQRIKDQGVSIRGGMLVTGVTTDPASGDITSVQAKGRDGQQHSFPADAAVICVSVSGMKKLLQASPELAAHESLRRIMNLKSVDVVATRVWFDRKVSIKNPSNVIAGFENSMGGTFFNLNELHDEYRDSPGTVIAADFYHASELLPLSDAQIVERLHRTYLTTCIPDFAECKVVDSWVGKFPQAVTCFSPGSYGDRPLQQTPIQNLFLAGDWVKGVKHGANGLSQERAYVTGLTAGNLAVRRCGVGAEHPVLDTEADEQQVVLGRAINGLIKGVLVGLGLPDFPFDFPRPPSFLP